jgi:hypothetical protein
LQVEALAVHPHRDVPNPGPRIEPGPESMKGPIIRGHRAPGEADSSTQELAAWVEHGLLDDLIGA